MENLLAFYPTGLPFQLFSAQHVLALLLITALNLSFAVFLKDGHHPRLREWLRYILIVVLILVQIAWNWWQWLVGIWTIADSLPLQICTLSEALATWMLLTRSQRLFAFLYFWCLAGAGNGLFTPDIVIYGFPHARYWIFFISHGANVCAILFMVIAYGYRPSWQDLWHTVVLTNVYLGCIMLVNMLTGGNYMYVARKPDFPSLMDFMGPWPWYILGLEFIGLLSFLLVYAPFALSQLARGEQVTG